MSYHEKFHEANLRETYKKYSKYSSKELFSHPDHLGSGVDVHAMHVCKKGLDLVLRIPRNDITQATDPMPRRIQALQRGVDLPHLEQLYAHPEEEDTVATHRIIGESLRNLTQRSIVDMHETNALRQLAVLSDVVHDAGVYIDATDRNFIYSLDGSINTVDYRIRSPGERSPNETLGRFVTTILNVAFQPRIMQREGLDPALSLDFVDDFEETLTGRKQDEAYKYTRERIADIRTSFAKDIDTLH